MYKEVNDNIWSFEDEFKVVTTNETIKKDGAAVMGKGLAFYAAKKFPSLPTELADDIKKYGNHCFIYPGYKIITLPLIS